MTLATAVLLASGCTVGPDYHPPAAPRGGYTTAAPGSSVPTASDVRLAYGARVSADWYRLFGSAALDTLIRRAIAANPTLDVVRARVAQAQAQLRAANGGRFPQLAGRAVANRAHLNPRALGIPIPAPATDSDAFAGVLQLSYNLDVFGKLRRQIEAQGASVEHTRAQALAAYIDLVDHIVITALDAATAQSLIDATHSLVDAQRQQLQIVQLQERVGTVARAASLTAQAQVESTEATVPALRQRRAAAHAALAALVGTTPIAFNAPRLTLADFRLPGTLPVSLPSQLVEQRPDILAARALLHAASANLGVAIAARLPAVSLSADYGSLSDRGADFFNAPNALWALGANLAAPLFQGGRLAAQETAAKAGLQAAQAQYRETVLNAFAEVATALRALDNDGAALAAHDRALDTAREALRLSDLQFRTGTVGELQVLRAQQEYRSERLARVTAQAQQLADVATLVHALGGGWWNAPQDALASSSAATTPAVAP